MERLKTLISENSLNKFLKFKRNLEVNLNPNLKWCPRPNCEKHVKKPAKNKVVCECGQEICFDCGFEWHGKKKCQTAIDEKFQDWLDN